MIKIKQNSEIIAEFRTDHPRSSYETPIWTIINHDPESGPATFFFEDGDRLIVEITEVRDGWLVFRDALGYLFGVVWSDGSYFCGQIIDTDAQPVKEMCECCQVAGTLPIGQLGAVGFI